MVLNEKSVWSIDTENAELPGIKVSNICGLPQYHPSRAPHRSSDYTFIYVRHGYFSLNIDFEKINISSGQICFVSPSQVQQITAVACDTWIIQAKPFQINSTYQSILEYQSTIHQTAKLDTDKEVRLINWIRLLFSELQTTSDSVCGHLVMRGLIDAIVGLFSDEYGARPFLVKKLEGRTFSITAAFRRLLIQHYRSLKKPSDYAEALKISRTYLNEVVKQSSGKTVSYWILQTTMAEAKRLLYYTDKSVKNIAYDLGYHDPAYFSRLFSKTMKVSPQLFRLETHSSKS
jgi:AraC family transcriptional activator of pobA